MTINIFNTLITDLVHVDFENTLNCKWREDKNLAEIFLRVNEFLPKEIVNLFSDFNLNFSYFSYFSYCEFNSEVVGDRIDYSLIYEFSGEISENLFLNLEKIDPYPLVSNSQKDKWFGLAIYKKSQYICIEIYFKAKYLL